MIEYAPQGGGIGLGKIRFENLSCDHQQMYGFNPERSLAYQAAQLDAQKQLRKELLARQALEWAANKKKDDDNFTARQEIEKRNAEIAIAEAEARKAEAEAKRMDAEAVIASARENSANNYDPYFDYDPRFAPAPSNQRKVMTGHIDIQRR